MAKALDNDKGREDEFVFYSGFVYEMTGLYREIYKPMCTMSRIVG